MLFNRFYQPDIDADGLTILRALHLSNSGELLRLRWLAVLSGRIRPALAVTGGVHTALDAIKAVMAAHAVQLVSALLQRGPHYLATIRERVSAWMEEHEYESLSQMQGSMNLQTCPDPSVYERANYMLTLQSWRPAGSPLAAIIAIPAVSSTKSAQRCPATCPARPLRTRAGSSGR